MKYLPRILLGVCLCVYFLTVPAFAETGGGGQFDVNATVPATPPDFQADLQKTTPGDLFLPETIIGYNLLYGSHLPYPTNLTLQVSWSRGTLDGDTMPSVDVLDYVLNNTTNGYNGVPPVIDLLNQTITWTINGFPPSLTDQIVHFALNTNNNYTGSLPVSFTVSGRVFGPGTQTPDSSITSTYRFTAPPSTSPITPTPQPQVTVATPTPTPIQHPLEFTDISLQSVSQNAAALHIGTNKPTNVTIRYGTTLTGLVNHLSDLPTTTDHSMTLEGLSPDTVYYLQISATNTDGHRMYSDFFTFRTAKVSQAPTIESNTLVATSQDVLLFASHLFPPQTKPDIVIPTNTVFDFQFALSQADAVNQVQALLETNNVLAASTSKTPETANTKSIDLTEIKQGVYAGKLLSTNTPGSYALTAVIADENGNLTRQHITDVRVIPPFQILQKGSNKPIEHARVLFSVYNERSRIFEQISPASMPIKNPMYSDPSGIVPVILPQGTYKAEVTAINQPTQYIVFTIGPHTGDDYPTVYLNSMPFNGLATVSYYFATCQDFLVSLSAYLAQFGFSQRFYDLAFLVTILLVIILLYRLLIRHTHLALRTLPNYLAHTAKLKSIQASYIHGRIIDAETDKPLSQAVIYLIDTLDRVVAHAVSNRDGYFSLQKHPHHPYSIRLLKDGYVTVTDHLTVGEEQQPLTFGLSRHSLTLGKTLHYSEILLTRIWLTVAVCVVCLTALIFGYTKGLTQTLPLLCLATLSLFLWIGETGLFSLEAIEES